MGAKAVVNKLVKALQRQRWVAAFVGVLAVAIIIWFLGPKIAFGGSRPLATAAGRLIAIAAVFGLWGLYTLIKRLRATRTNRAMAQDLVDAQQAVKAAGDEEITVLKAHFQAAVDLLKRTRVKGSFGNQYLYELPWYVIIGPPGSGKTTALVNSGLDFPLADRLGRDPVRGIGGTRNCDWWFTNEAVLLDTAGRYTTQDSQQDTDAAAWKGFLNLLKKYRPRRPINGILVAVPLADLMVQSPDERERQSRTVRQRIKELYEQFGLQVPVYVMFTKADLIAGFTEFFDDLGKEQRAQVWGATFGDADSRDTAQLAGRFGAEFDALVDRLHHRALWRLYQERDGVRRSMINGFPQQMAGLKEPLTDFLQKTFTPSRFEEPIRVRGVYLTSGTQEGTPIDRVMAALARTFGLGARGLAAQRGGGRSYFITRLLQDVVFAESDLAGANRRFERQLRWLRLAAYAGVAAVSIGVVLAWSMSFTRNQALIGTLENRIAKYRQIAPQAAAAADVPAILPALQDARDVAQVYDSDPDHTPWLLGMGLYQGYKLGHAARAAYQRVLQRLWLPHIKRRLEQLIQTGADHPNELRRLLSLYLMLGKPETFNRPEFKRWLEQDWEQRYADRVDIRQQLEGHLPALLSASLPSQPLDEGLTAGARRIICNIPLADQVYARLKEEADAAGLAPFDLASLGNAATTVLTAAGKARGDAAVPNLYTRDGYHKVFKEKGASLTRATIDENNKLCDTARAAATAADPQQLLREVRGRYLKDYVDRWQDFLRRVRLVDLQGMAQGLDALKQLSGGNSPLQQLVAAADKQTHLGDLAGKLLGDDTAVIDHAFQDLHQLLQAAKKGDKAKIDGVTDALGELYTYVDGIGEASRVSEAAFNAAKRRMSGGDTDVIAKLNRTANEYPAPVADVVKSAATQAWGLILGGARGYVDAQWRATVLPDCRDTLENRYPISPRSRRDVTLEDFGRFFGANGTIDTFAASYLQPFVHRRDWRPRVKDGHGLGLSPQALALFRRAALIRKVYFQNGGQSPLVNFSMRPIHLSPAASRFQLEVDGQLISYRHGPTVSQRLSWPSSQGPDRARIVFDRINGGTFTTTKDGPWAWFRLLDEARVTRGNAGDRLRVTFKAANLEAAYELQASSVANPFGSRELTRFSCPVHL